MRRMIFLISLISLLMVVLLPSCKSPSSPEAPSAPIWLIVGKVVYQREIPIGYPKGSDGVWLFIDPYDGGRIEYRMQKVGEGKYEIDVPDKIMANYPIIRGGLYTEEHKVLVWDIRSGLNSVAYGITIFNQRIPNDKIYPDIDYPGSTIARIRVDENRQIH